jgi:hypothetical protein
MCKQGTDDRPYFVLRKSITQHNKIKLRQAQNIKHESATPSQQNTQ